MWRILSVAFLFVFGVTFPQYALCQQEFIEPGQAIALNFITYPPTPNIYINFQIRIGVYSGYHNHDDPSRPPGLLSSRRLRTNASGAVTVTYYSPGHSLTNADPIAGGYQIVAYLDDGSSYDDITIVARIPDLNLLPAGNSYNIVGQTPQHPIANYGTANAVAKIIQICDAYYAQTGSRVGVNDMSLPLGGRFDLGPAYSGPSCTRLWWKPCHATHTAGLNADIPFSSLSNRQLFYEIARTNGGNPYEEGSHYHLRFTY